MPKFMEDRYFNYLRLFLFSTFISFCFTWFSLLPFWRELGFFPNFFILIYFNWLLYRPDLMSLPQILIISFFQDGVYNYPIGFSVLHYLLLFVILLWLRKSLLNSSFPILYAAFAGITLLDTVLSWGILSWHYGLWVAIAPFLKGMTLVIMLYPTISIVSLYLQRKLV